MRNLTPLLLSAVFLAGCASHTATTPTAQPTLADQVALADTAFQATAIGVELFADAMELQPATRQRIHDAVDAARTLVANLKSDFAAGRLDAIAVIRRVNEAAETLRQKHTATVAAEPKARQPRAVKSQ